MSLLPQPTCKADLQVQISAGGSPTPAFFTTVGAGAVNAGISMARQIVSWDRVSVVAKNATTGAGRIIPWPDAERRVVKESLTTGHGGNFQGLIDSSPITAGQLRAVRGMP